MPKSVFDLLLDSLDDLDDDQFKRFTSKLTDSRQGVRKADVQGKDRGDVASKLIDTFTKQRALEVTVQLLKDARFKQTAEDLEKGAAANGYSLSTGAANEPSPSTGAGGPAAEKTTSGDISEDVFIDEKFTSLIQRATGVDAILDALLSKKIINNTQYSEITAERTPQKMMSCLIRGPINASGKWGKIELYKVLMEQQPYMMKDLGAR